jgi:LPXTG-site transpeptidase (sortase) family protein
MSHHKSEYRKVLLLRTIGNFLIISSLLMIIKTFYLPVRQELQYALNQVFNKTYALEGTPQAVTAPEDRRGALARALTGRQKEILTPADPEFSIVIPKIGANANIISNVDAAEESEYNDALQRGVAHTRGTAFPGEDGHIFLFAHSTDYFWNVGTYNAVFYLLPKLEKNDEVNLFYKGQRYRYQVVSKIIVDPSQVEYITRKSNKEFLTLQTCWPPGTTLKRQLVFATRVVE